MPLLSDETVIQKANYRVNTAGTKLNCDELAALQSTAANEELRRENSSGGSFLTSYPATEASRPQAWS